MNVREDKAAEDLFTVARKSFPVFLWDKEEGTTGYTGKTQRQTERGCKCRGLNGTTSQLGLKREMGSDKERELLMSLKLKVWKWRMGTEIKNERSNIIRKGGN